MNNEIDISQNVSQNNNEDIFGLNPNIFHFGPSLFNNLDMIPTPFLQLSEINNQSILSRDNDSVSTLSAIDDTILNNTIQQSLEDYKSEYVNVISDKGKELLEPFTYIIDNSNNYEYHNCPITCDDFEDGEELLQLPCNHYFNKEAILKWLEESSNKCPICRYELPSKEKKNIETLSQDEVHNEHQHQDTQNTLSNYINTNSRENILINNNIMNQTFSNILNNPFGTLNNRQLIPHSYLSDIIQNTLHNDEEEIMQQILFNIQ